MEFWQRLLCSLIPIPGVRRRVRNKLRHLPPPSDRERINFWDSSNEIVIAEEDGTLTPIEFQDQIPGIGILCLAKNCRVVLHKPFRQSKMDIHIWEGSDNTDIEIGKNLSAIFLGIYAVDHSGKMRIGDDCAIVGALVHLSGGFCEIGEKCLLSGEILIYTHDTHSIIDPETKKLLNGEARGVRIGAESWVGRHALFTKNANVAAHTVVAMGAVVTKTFDEEFIAVGGNPAVRLGKTGQLDTRRESVYQRYYEANYLAAEAQKS